MLSRIIITAGGTGGHIFPAVALAEEFIANGTEVLYVGNRNSMEERVAGERNLTYAAIDVQKLYRSFTLKHLVFPFKFFNSCLMSSRIIGKYKPDACLGTGGFVSGPVMMCAVLKRIPIYLQEQNSYPGLTTRLFSRFAKKIFLGYDQASNYLPGKRCIFTGNPLQKSLILTENAAITPGNYEDKEKFSLLVLGGSQGAQRINDCLLNIVPKLMEMNIKLIWQTGSGNYKRITENLAQFEETEDIEAFPFTSRMSDVYRRADIAITRAGALSLAELEAWRVPAIIIPLPKSAGNHQTLNARQQEAGKKALVIKQDELYPDSLLKAIRYLRDNLDIYKRGFSDSKHVTATANIVDHIIIDQRIRNDNSFSKKKEN